nr:hypothetical protein [Kibdelosporangium sp. MJ126-NF4]
MSRDDMITLEGDNEEIRTAYARAGFVMQIQAVFDSGEEHGGSDTVPFETYTIQWFESAAGACDYLARERRRAAEGGLIGPGSPRIPGSHRSGASSYRASKGRFVIWVRSFGIDSELLLKLLYDRLP